MDLECAPVKLFHFHMYLEAVTDRGNTVSQLNLFLVDRYIQTNFYS
jgi:hypothetical protein